MEPLDAIQRQLNELNASVRQLNERMNRLEGQGRVVPPTPTMPVPPAPPPGPTTRMVTINPAARWTAGIAGFVLLNLGYLGFIFPLLGLVALIMTIAWPWKKRVTVTPPQPLSAPNAPGLPASAPAALKPRRPSQFEQDLAKHWFSWLGIISLVVGVTLLLNYAFRGLGPIGRVFTGYAAAAMLFGLWLWLRHTYRGFAFVLQSGAWAIVYISTYALHVIEGQPVASPVTAGLFLLGVVAAISLSAIMQRSRSLTAGAFSLGYVTAFTNTVDVFTLAALLALSIGAVAIASLQRWPELVLGATAATYMVQFAWLTNQPDLSRVAATAAGFLVLEVLVFGAAHWLIAAGSERQRQLTLAGTVMNLTGFYGLFNFMVSLSKNPYSWVATVFIGIVCGLLAGATLMTTSRRYLRPVYIVFAIGFITMALSQRLHGDSLTVAWLIESAAVVCVGAITGERTIRLSGYAVSFIALVSLMNILTGPARPFGLTAVSARLVLGLFGAVLMTLNAAVLRYQRSKLSAMERYVPVIFADIGIALAVTLAGQELPEAWVPVVWSTGAMGVLLLGITLKSANARIVSYVVTFLAMLFWMANVMGATNFAGALPIHARLLSGMWVVALAAAQGYVLRARRSVISRDEAAAPSVHAWFAVVLLTIVLGAEVSLRTLSVAWGIEGVALYIIGFAAQSVQARRQGLFVLALTIAKVYLIDVRTLAAPYQILSFIILGLILLGIGFLYNRWRQQSKPTVRP